MSLYNPMRQAELSTVQSAFSRPRGQAVGKSPHLSPIVTIFGAGIAGLSAAHELIERGFAVQVVEPTRSPDEEYAVEVGGLARNQFGRVPENPVILHETAKPAKQLPETEEQFRTNIAQVLRLRSTAMQRVQPRFTVPSRIRFEPGTYKLDDELADEWGVRNRVKLVTVWETLKDAYRTYSAYVDQASRPETPDGRATQLPDDWLDREALYVEIRGHTDGDQNEAENRRVSDERAKEVLEYLKTLDGGKSIPHFDKHFRVVPVGSAEPIGDQRDPAYRRRSNRVEFRIVEQLVPGEHGYRFFPAFYRHLFDIMRRTPILDENNHATGQTAYERLVATPDLGLATGDEHVLASLETRRVRSLEELRKLSELFFRRLGVTHRDIARFQARMLKFLTSSATRRGREYERMSWWQFLGGESDRGYSDRMRHFLMETSQALVAMNAEETDARSQGNIVSQLQLHYLKDSNDFTLNGPTSDVWLRIWKKYLKRQGVRFFVGELGRLNWKVDSRFGLELIPVTTRTSGWLLVPPPPPPPQPPVSDTVVPETPEPLIAGLERRTVVIEVLDNDDGDYTIVVSGQSYCVTARGYDRKQIAELLANKLGGIGVLSVKAKGSRVVIKQKLEVRVPAKSAQASFDNSDVPGTWKIERQLAECWQLTPVPKDQKEVLLKRLNEHDQAVKSAQEGKARSVPPSTASYRVIPKLDLINQEWAQVGLLRGEDPDFDKLVSDYEKKWKREIVPCIELDKTKDELVLKPSDWVKKLLEEDDEDIARDVYTVCPYYNRTYIENSQPTPPQWIRVHNANGNLCVLAEPSPEEPGHDYLSHAEAEPGFRPDFYVLALPFEQASTLVWRAEADRPGVLHGCLSEILDFDRSTYRRTPTGQQVRTLRDAHGRPPYEHPLRDFAGVQYYFHNQVRIGKGHIYFPAAEWGLSSVSQLAYWRERMSPAGPFMGQLSVDVGNFYNPAPARHGSRMRRSAWNSAFPEIAAEVWFQVRQGLGRERAGILSAPAYFHVDEGLSFDGPRGSTFREEAFIVVKPDGVGGMYTVWVNGEPFSHNAGPAETAKQIATDLAKAISEAPFGAIETKPEPIRDRDGNPTASHQLRVSSRVPHGAALLIVTEDQPGSYELTISGKTYLHVSRAAPSESREQIRDGLFQQLTQAQTLPVSPRLSGKTAILLVPKGSEDLPRLEVRNDHQNLTITYGPTLNMRLEQCNGALLFRDFDSATIGYNKTPFLINIPGQWQHRPGLFQPSELTFEETVLRPGKDERIRYRISNRRWVAAGTYMATTTQLTTMESANESARHAVNAILRCLAFQQGSEFNSQGRVFADLAEIWDPEKYELDDLEPLKRLDQKLVDEGLPHVMDILKIIDAVDAMPMHGKPSHDPVANMLHLLQHLADGSNRDWAFLKQTVGDFLGQAVERAHDGIDPLGLIRELGKGPGEVAEHIGSALRSFMSGLGGGSKTDSGSKPGT